MRSGDLLSLSDVDGAQPAGQLSQELVAKAGDAGDSYTSSNKVLLSARFATSSTSTPQNTATTQSTPHKASVDYRLQSEDATPLFDSLWAGAPGTSSGTAVELQAPLTKEVLYLRFGNVYSDIMTGLHRYSEQGTQRVPLGPLHVSVKIMQYEPEVFAWLFFKEARSKIILTIWCTCDISPRVFVVCDWFCRMILRSVATKYRLRRRQPPAHSLTW